MFCTCPMLAELIVCSTRGFACILAKWFGLLWWVSLLHMEVPRPACNKRADTYFGRRSASLMKEFWTLCIFVMTVSKTVMVETIPYSNIGLTHCRLVKWCRDLGPTFCWPIFLSDEIFGCSVLKFPQSVLWNSSYCQMWYLRILCEDSTKEGHCTGSALIADRDLENIVTSVFSGFSFILHLAHHLASLLRSLCRYSAAKSTLDACFHNPFYLSLVYMRPQCMIFNLNLMPPSQSKHSLYGMRWVFLTHFNFSYSMHQIKGLGPFSLLVQVNLITSIAYKISFSNYLLVYLGSECTKLKLWW